MTRTLLAALALACALLWPAAAEAMSQMDLPAGYPPPRSYLDGAIIGLAAAAWLLIVGRWFRAPSALRSLPWAVACLLLITAQCLAGPAQARPRRCPHAVPVFIEGVGTVWIFARPPRRR